MTEPEFVEVSSEEDQSNSFINFTIANIITISLSWEYRCLKWVLNYFSVIWTKFNQICRDQMNPSWEIEQKEEEICDEINGFENYKKQMIEAVKKKHRLKVRQFQERFLEVEKIESFCQDNLISLTNDLFQLIDWADEQACFKKRYRAVIICPFCRKKIFFKTKIASNKIVTCPYRACKKRITVSFT